jgi:hypothetical protein
MAAGFADRRRCIRIKQHVNVALRQPGEETMQQLRQTWGMGFRDKANALHPPYPFVEQQTWLPIE